MRLHSERNLSPLCAPTSMLALVGACMIWNRETLSVVPTFAAWMSFLMHYLREAGVAHESFSRRRGFSYRNYPNNFLNLPLYFSDWGRATDTARRYLTLPLILVGSLVISIGNVQYDNILFLGPSFCNALTRLSVVSELVWWIPTRRSSY